MKQLTVAGLVVVAMMFAAAPWVINAAPWRSTMGLVYKIFFFHMPSAWLFLIAAIVSGVYSALFLQGKSVGRLEGVGGRRARVSLWCTGARDRAAVGAQGVGRLVGVGCSADEQPAGLDDFRRVSPVAPRRAWVRQARRGHGAVRYGHCAVHLRVGQLLAHAAPADLVVPTLPMSMGGPLWFCFSAFFLLFLILMARVRLERQRALAETLYLSRDES